jgi:predicted nucleic acid-binding protein
MRICWFPDNTVLCNFAVVDRLTLLQAVLDGRGRWSSAVAYEAEQSARVVPHLWDVVRLNWLGDPVEITEAAEQSEVERIRRAVFGGTSARPTQHLGEAETCVLIQTRPEFKDAVWITDDRSAGSYARRRGITTRETFDLMNEAVVGGLVPAVEGHRLLHRMVELDRVLHRISQRPEDLLG